MNAPLRFPTIAPSTHPLAAAVMNAVLAAEHANSFNDRANVGRDDIDAWNEAFDAKQAMLAQFRTIGLDETMLGRLAGVL